MSRPSSTVHDEGRSSEPLLDAERGRSASVDGDGNSRRRAEFRSRSPVTVKNNRNRYALAALMLVLSLGSFVLQTETAQYIQRDLGWNKAYCMMYLTHGSWTFLWPAQLLVLRIRKRQIPFKNILRSHISLLRSTIDMILQAERSNQQDIAHPFHYLLRCIGLVTTALTIAGSTWYIAVNLTTPSDLTAIYNCSAFFAYAFSIPLLREKPQADKIISVMIAIVGVLVVAYGDNSDNQDQNGGASTRLAGNMLIGIGSILYGLYEVLYKKLLCPPSGTSSGRSVIFSNTVCACIGAFTLLVLWIPLPLLHWTGWETFEIPTGETARLLCISIFANAVFSGSFLILISLTSPVLSSVAALLTIFLVAITDKILFGRELTTAAILGGLLIIAAFALLSWATWKEMREESEKEISDLTSDVDDDHDD
ncbi:hypothetical protein TWF730_004142 [Orbilia blumenaviensis]|uniref:EamA domain-containing protein n=1 Tax=Orbilia blumenaviensis TaxID=1796055 RepID=A0AAV9U1V3_9PEZI